MFKWSIKKVLGMIMILLVETNTFSGHPKNRGEEKITYNEKAKETHLFIKNL